MIICVVKVEKKEKIAYFCAAKCYFKHQNEYYQGYK